MQRVKFIVQAVNYRDRGGYWRDYQRGGCSKWIEWEITAEKPEGIDITVCNAYQIFLRSCTDRALWRVNCYDLHENEHDTEKLDTIKVLSIKQVTPQTHKPLFNLVGAI